MLYRYDYCQFANRTNVFFTDVQGVCADSADLNKPNVPPVYKCSDMFLSVYKMEWLTFLPCMYQSLKCGSKT